MPQVTYTADRNKAIAASAAFNFPDRNTMLFTCKIKLCYNSDSECHRITVLFISLEKIVKNSEKFPKSFTTFLFRC
jgi:hypothetical protein